jgi:hypothetical protein
MIDKRITTRKNFQGGGRDASTTSFSKSFDRQMGTNTASRANKTVDRQQREGQNQADRDNRRIELNRLARQSAAEKQPDVKPNPFQRGGGGIGGLLMSLLGFAMGIPGLGLAFSKKGMDFINKKFRGTNPDGSIRTQAEYEQSMYDKRQQNRLDKLFAAKDRGYNQIGFGDFTAKTVDFTPGQQAKIDELLAAGYEPSTARNILTGRDLNLRGTLNQPATGIETIQQLAQPNINAFPGIDNSMYGADRDRYRIPSFIDEYDSNLGIETNLNLQAGPDGITYYNNDQQPQQQFIEPLAPNLVDPVQYQVGNIDDLMAGNYSQNAVGNQLYNKDYDLLTPFEQQQIDKAIETYGTSSTGKLA